ncbi:YHYH domain-containing protein [Litorivicinus sp.]|nr:YHYH domain-containing protein [Litorivicinus sp.]
MKKNVNGFSFKFFLISGLFSVAEAVHSHGGGLNAEGCHNNRKTGDYHCHRSNSNSKSPLKITPRLEKNYERDSSEPIIPYDRDLYGYESYPTYSSKGFYTSQTCDTNIDHVVSLKDAHESGASRWTITERITFSNDRLNHVPSCSRVNSSKGSSTPSDFFRKSNDGRGMDYEIRTKCAYLGIYYQVKRKYQLSLSNNDPSLFASCGLDIL